MPLQPSAMRPPFPGRTGGHRLVVSRGIANAPWEIKCLNLLVGGYALIMLTLLPFQGLNRVSNLIALFIFGGCLFIMTTSWGRLRLAEFPYKIFLCFFGLVAIHVAYALFQAYAVPDTIRLGLQTTTAFIIAVAVFRTGKTLLIFIGFVFAITIMVTTSWGTIMTTVDEGRRFYAGRGEESTGLNPNQLGLIIIFAIALASKALLFDIKHIKDFLARNMLYGFAVFVIAAGFYLVIFALGSRQHQLGLLYLIGAIPLMFMNKRQAMNFLIAYVVVVPMLLGVFVLLLQQSAHIDRVMRMFNFLSGTYGYYDGSVDTRMFMIMRGLRLWLESPVWGGGYYHFAIADGYGSYSHNNYVELLANFGIIGFLSFYLPFYFTIRKLWQCRNNQGLEYKRLVTWTLIVLGLFLIQGFFRPTIYLKYIWLCYGITFGYAFYLIHVGRRRMKPRMPPGPGMMPGPPRVTPPGLQSRS
jgi:O-antigen ligase